MSSRLTERARMLVQELEQRVLYSADAAQLLGLPVGLAPQPKQIEPAAVASTLALAQAQQSAARELVFIDSRVPDAALLLDQLMQQRGSERAFDIVMLNATEDGVAQINRVLAGEQELTAIHIISHGSAGMIEIGSTQLDAAQLARNGEAVARWGQALTVTGDLLLYGCDVAQGVAGQAFLQQLARLTSADVAASDDATGSAAIGGNWTLEFATGALHTQLVPSTFEQLQWQGVLATYTVTNTNDTGAGSLRQAILDANGNAGADLINFNIAGAGVQTIALAAALPQISGQVNLDASTQPGYAGTPLTRIDGAAAGAGVDGLSLAATSDGSTIRGFMITRFTRDGILIQAGADSITVAGNWIGTTGTGSTGVGNSDDGIDIAGSFAVIGGLGANDRNVVTNSADEGITIVGSGVTGHLIQGNYIGVDPDGATGGGNTDVGLAIISGTGNTIGGTSTAAGNVISKNWDGIEINTSNNVVQGNTIGTDATGTLNRGNRFGDGVQVQGGSTNNLIGGTAAGAGNLIAFNALDGVNIVNGSGDAVLGNLIHSNAGLGIDLGTSGVTANDAGDADSGANNLQNFPLLTSAQVISGTQVVLVGSINSTASSFFRVEFFASIAANASGYGEAQRYLGFANVTTDGSGNATISTTLTATVTAGEFISATATKSNNVFSTFTDTSEFAANVVATNATRTFQEGTAGYTGTQDTYVTSNTPATAYGTADHVYMDLSNPSAGVDQALLRFDNLFGGGANQIPLGSTILSATLTLYVDNNAPGATISFHRMLINWSEASTWSSLASGISANGTDAVATADAAFTNTTATGSVTVTGLQNSLQAWSNGAANEGWAILTDSTDGWAFVTSEYATVNLRPSLDVQYTVNAAPALDNARSPALTVQAEDSGAPVGTVGTLVSALIDFATPAGQVDNVTDADAGAQLGIAITAADTANGSWWYSINGGANWNALGAVADSNARLLAADANTRVYFQPTANYNGNIAAAITLRAWDQTSGNNGSLADASVNGGTAAFSTATDTASLTVTAVNDAPTATNLSTAETYTEDTALNLTDIVISDVDSANVTATLTLSNVAAGSLNTATSGAVTSTYNAGTGVWSASGAIANVNTLLAGLSFTPALNFNANFTITTSVNDGVAAPVTGSKALTGTAVNDAPVIGSDGGGATAALNVAENGMAVTTVNATDVDVPAQTLVYSLSGGADAAKFTINSSTGALSFIVAPNYEAPTDAGANNVYDVTVQVSDGTLTDTQAVAVTVTDQGENALWVSSVSNTTVPAAQGGISWTDGDVIRLGDPNLALVEPGVTNGSFSKVFNIDTFAADGNADINALHYVNRGLTVGSANAVALQAGDVLFSVDSNETLGGVAVTKDDVLRFRPSAPGNYSAGTFSILLQSPVGNDIWGIALVETNTTVGGAALAAGEFLLTLQGAVHDKAIWRYTPSDVGPGTTAGSLSKFIDGPNINIGQTIRDIELVQATTILGGKTLTSGQLLATLDNDDSSVGSNNTAVAKHDIFILDVTATGAGTTAATASLLFEGADVGISAGGEEFDAIALVAPNVAPVITSNGGGAAALVNSAENTTAVTTVTATDADLPAQTLTYSISGGADAAKFAINPTTGTLSFIAAPNFEAPTDSGANNIYDVTVQVSDGALTDTQAIAVTVTNVNEAPTATNLGAAENYTEDTPLNLTDIVASDVDSASVTATLTLSNVAAGSLNTATSGAVTSTYNAGTGVWSASGAIANVNTLLAGLTFAPALNFNANFTIATSVSDGVAAAITGSKAMTGTAVNDAPTATNLSAAESYTEDTALNLTDIVISDVDSASVTATLTLSNVAAGALNTGTSGAVTSTYNAGTGVWSASGAIADVNTLLAALSFTPALNFNASFTIATSVSDGVAAAITGTKAMTGTAVNDAPSATNLSAAETYTEDTALNLTDIVISDVDSASVTATLTLSNIAAGSLNTGTSGAVTSTYNAGTGVWSASGAIADVNTLLAALSFTPALNFNANFTIATSVSDGVAAAITGSKAMTGTAVNDAPAATNLSAAETYTEDIALNLTDIVISDVDSASVTATLTLSNTAAGSLNTGTSGAVTSTYNAGTGVWSASGAIADVNTLLAALSFTPALNFNASFTIATSASDGVAAALTGSKAMTGTAVNDAPNATNLSAAETYTEDTVLNLTDIVISDVDSASVTATLTLSNTAAGSLNTGTSGAVTSTYNAGTGVWSASGAIADVNTLLAALSFTPALNFNASFTIATSVSDGVAAAITGTKAMTGTAVNDAPTATNLSAAETYTEDTVLNLTDIVISDVDSASVTATLTLSNIAAGSLNTGTSGAVTSIYNAGTGVWSASGALADVNILLAALTFTPALNFNANFTIATSVSDGSLSVTGSKAMTGTAVNDAPVLDNTGTMTLPTITKIQTNNGGSAVATIIASAGGDRITDVDGSAVEGIAITTLASGNGSWEYSTNGGASFAAIGAVSGTSALLLSDTDYVRFVPNGVSGTVASFDFRAWDQTSGSAGTKVSVASNGGSTPYSSAFESASIVVDDVNVAPLLDASKSPVLAPANEDAGAPVGAVGTLVSALVDFASPAGQVDNVTDADTGAGLGIAVTAANTSNGSWHYSVNNGVTWNALGAVSDANARLLAADANTRLYFQPNANYFGTQANAIALRAWDQTSGSNGGMAVVTATHTVLDRFSTVAYTNNDGTQLWASNWIEVGDPNGATGGGIKVINSNELQVTAETAGYNVYRGADLGDSSSATLSFAYSSTLTGARAVEFQVSANGGSTYTTLATFDASTNTGAGTKSYDIGAYMASNTRIRILVATGSPGTEAVMFDDVQIQYTNAGGGSSAFSTATDSASLVVNPVADTPAVSNATTNEDTQSSSGLVISRNAADGAEVTHFKVTGISNGTLYKNDGTTPITSGAFITFAEGNAGLKFTPTANFNGSGSFTVQASTSNLDAGLGGSTVNATITVNAVNDAPSASNLSAGETYTEDTPLNLSDIVASDVDSASVTATLTLSNIAAGSLNTATSGAVTSTYNAGTGVWSASGAIANVNTLLAGLTFTPALNFNANFTIATSVSDGVAAPVTGSKAMTGSAVNDAPVITSNGGGASASISVAENTTAATTVTSSDVDGGVAAYSISGGADAAKFTINGASGALTFLAAPDFELPTDAGANNIYDVTVQVADGNGGLDTQAIAVTVTNVADQSPVITLPGGAASYTENAVPVVINAAATLTDADSANFAGGVLTIDFTANGTASDRLAIRDQGAGAGRISLSGANVRYDFGAGAVTIGTFSGGSSGSDPLVIALNASSNAVSVQALLRNITFQNVSENPTTAVRTVRFGMTDGSGGPAASVSTTVNVIAVNDASVVTAAATPVAYASGQIVVDPTLTVIDVDSTTLVSAQVRFTTGYIAGEDTLVFTNQLGITGTFSSATGTLTLTGAATVADYQTALRSVRYEDVNGSPTPGTLRVTFRVNDGVVDSNTAQRTINIVNDEPPRASNDSATVAEGGAVLVNLAANDSDNTALNLASIVIQSAPANGAVVVNGDGTVTYTHNGSETLSDSFTYTIKDNLTLQSNVATVALTITPVNDVPVITSGGAGPAAAVSVAENVAAVTTVTAADVDLPAQTLTFSIAGGADAAKFAINGATGALSFLAAPDFEAPTDSGGNNVYDVTVQVSDGNGGSDTQAIAVTVTPVNDNAPVISSNGGGASAAVSVAENATAATTVAAGDADLPAQTLTYSIAGGADAAKFAINASSGALSFIAAPNFEAPTDAGANNVYDVTVQASDGSFADTQAIAVTVTNVNEAPTATNLSAAETYTEDTALNLTDIVATDLDSANVTATLTLSNTGAGSLSTATSGAVTSTYVAGTGMWTASGAIADVNALLAGLAFTPAADFNSSFTIATSVSDGVATPVTGSKAITGTAANDAPVRTAGVPTAISVTKDSANVTAVTLGMSTLAYGPGGGSDESGQTLTYTVTGTPAHITLWLADGSTPVAANATVTLTQLQGLKYKTVAGATGSGDLTWTVVDNGGTANGGANTVTETLEIAVDVFSGMAIWANNTSNPQHAQWNGVALGTASAPNSLGEWTHVQAAESPTRTEIIAVGVDANGVMRGELWNGSTWAPFSFNTIVDLATTDFQSFQVAYEQQSGDAMLVWANGTSGSTSLSYRTWNGTAWSAAQTITTPVAGEAVQLRLAADPNSDSMILAVTGTPVENDYALVWNGSSWGNGVTLDTATGIDGTEIHVAYEAHSGRALVVYDADGTTNAINYRTWDATSWSAQQSLSAPAGVAAASDASFTVLVSDPNSNRIALGVVAEPEIWLAVWDGSSWGSTQTAAASAGSAAHLNVALAFEHDSGDLLAAYGKSGSNFVAYRTWTNAGGWSAETASHANLNLGATPQSLTLAADPNSNQLMLATRDSGNDVRFALWTGADWGAALADSTGDAGGAYAMPMAFVWYDNNRTPVIGTAALSMAENNTAAGSVASSDADGDARTYALIGGADQARFTINAGTGALSFVSAPNYESPTDTGSDNVYDVIVQVADGQGGTDSQAIAVSVTNVNEAPVLGTTGSTLAYTENGAAVAVDSAVTVTDPDSANLASAIVTISANYASGQDVLAFTDQNGITGNWNAGTGVLTLSGSATLVSYQAALRSVSYVNTSDNPSTATRTVSFVVNDGAASSNTATRNIDVAAVNDAPTAINLSAAQTYTEDTPLGLTSIVISDVDSAGASATLTLSNAAAGSLSTATSGAVTSTYNAGTGVWSASGAIANVNTLLAGLTFTPALNFNANFSIATSVSDGVAAPVTGSKPMTGTAVNDAPVITSNGGGASAAVNVAENATAVTTVSASDVDGGAAVYSIIGGADAAKFTINGASGALTFIVAPDYEAPTDSGTNNVYDVTVQVSDGNGGSDTQAIAVTVTPVNDNTPVISSDGGGATATVNVAENASAVTTVVATDADAGSTLTYSISGGADAAQFSINSSTGALSFVAARDFEVPADSGTNNVYDVTVQVSDGSFTDTQAIAVTVTPVNDNDPLITSNGGGASAAANVAENATAVTTVVATDADLPVQTLSYSISGGADAALFSINAASGALRFITAPDFEAPGDAGGDNVYDVTVSVSDGAGRSDAQALAVQVTNSNEAPTATIAAASYAASEQVLLALHGTGISINDPDGGATNVLATLSVGAGTLTVNAGASGAVVGGSGTGSVTLLGSVAKINALLAGIGGASVQFFINADAPPASTLLTLGVDDQGNSGSGGALTASASAVINISAVNDAPTLAGPGPQSVAEDGVLVLASGTGTHTVVSDADAGSSIIRATLSASNGTLTLASTVGLSFSSGDGTADASMVFDGTVAAINAALDGLVFNPAANYFGAASVSIGADDLGNSGSGGPLSASRVLAVNVTPVNDEQVLASNSGLTLAENATGQLISNVMLRATDIDNTPAQLVYTLSAVPANGTLRLGGVALGVAATFTQADIDAGLVSYDHDGSETAADSFTFSVDDGAGAATSASFAITITPVNDNAPVIGSDGGGASAALSMPENSTAVTTVAATDADLPAQGLTYSISGGADAALFSINAATGALSFLAAPDRETPADTGADNVYDVTVRASDGTFTDTQAIAVTVTPVNDNTPVITSAGGGASAALSMPENTTAVATVLASDADLPAQVLSFSIAGGADAALFSINAGTGVLSFTSAPDFETPTDAGSNNVYDVIVRVSDGTFIDTQAIAVTVTPVNDNTPVITSNGGGAGAAVSNAENTTALTTVAATDADLPAQVLNFSIVGGADAALFSINAGTGVLSFVTAPDYESPADVGGNNIYDVIVQASDGTFTDSQAIAVSVMPVNDNTPVITSDGGGASAALSMAENTTVVTSVTAMDADLPAQVLSFSITGGADAALFSINAGTGTLSFISAPDFETPTDAGANNVYDVIVRASDSTFTDTQAIAVTVTPVNDNTPAISSNGGGASAALSIAENTTAITTVAATDPDLPAQVLNFSIAGGADAALFNINAATGMLTFISAPDHEAPTDLGANNIYDVIVQASDGTFTDAQAIAVTVTPVNDNTPVVTSDGGGASAAVNVAETATAVTTVSASDADLPAQVLAYSIIGGADAALFSINAASGALSFISARDFEAPVDAGANNVYDVVVQASDGTFTDTQAIAVSITPVNDIAPVISSDGAAATAALAIAENTSAVTTVSAGDADLPAQVLAYSISGGADAALFSINASTGALSLVTAPDFEAPADVGANNVYDVVVQVSDGTFTDAQAIAVTVTPVNDNTPVVTSDGGGASAAVNVAENATAVTTVSASDADLPAQVLAYSIIGGADAALFSINAASGALSFISALDFEAPVDAGANNVYDVVVQASDGTFTDTQAIAVSITPVNDNTPVINSDGGGASAAVNVAENATPVATVSASDADLPAQVLAYSIVGGADAALFSINAASGALSFISARDFEAPVDVGANNVYDVVVQASDGTFTDSQAIAVSITPVNDNPPVISSDGAAATAALAIAENTSAVTTVSAGDADLPAQVLAYSISGGADAALFSINVATGMLTFISAPDHEAPTDLGANNIYDVIVQVSDGTFTDAQAIAVSVTPVNDNTPVVTSDGGGASAALSIPENTTAVSTVNASDADLPAQVLTYSISGGADAALFSINAASGALSFIAAPDFETPVDAGSDNVYDLVVRASDGTFTDTQAIAVSVTPVNDNTPVITSNGGGATAALAISENTTAVTTLAASDADLPAQALVYSISGGADAALFSIDAASGALRFITAPDHEVPADAGTDNVYDVTVQASDGPLASNQALAVTVLDANDNAPQITSDGGGATAVLARDENGLWVTQVSASDADATSVPVFSIAGGPDAARFSIDPVSGALTFITNPDFEAPADASGGNVYQLIVQASDGRFATTQVITVALNDLNDNTPVVASNGGGALANVVINENQTAVTVVAASDADAGTVFAYSIAGGADAARFAIDPASGVLTLLGAPDFEGPADVGLDNVYNVVVAASDGVYVGMQALAVRVASVNENPQAADLAAALDEAAGLRIDLAGTASDVDAGNDGRVDLAGTAITQAPAHGNLVVNLDGTVSYVHDGSETTADSFSYTLRDAGGLVSNVARVSLAVRAVNDAPVISVVGVRLESGEALVLTPAMVASFDPDTNTAQLEYTVSNAQHVRFELVGAPGVAISQFTQAQVDAGAVRVLALSLFDTPAWRMVVSDGALGSAASDAVVDFVVTWREASAPGGTSVTALLPLPAPPGEDAPVDSTALKAQQRSAEKSVQAVPEAADASADPGDAAVAGIERQRPAQRMVIMLNGNHVNRDVLINGNMDLLAPLSNEDFLMNVSLQSTLLGDAALAGQGSLRATLRDAEIGRVQVDVNQHSGLNLDVQAMQTAGVALTAGAVWWALRAGGLLASLVMSLPAWRHVDLLAVLPDADEDDEQWAGANDDEAARDERAVDAVLNPVQGGGQP